MNIKETLENVRKRVLTVEEALDLLKHLPYEEDIGYAKIDNQRSLTKGFPEVILAEFKAPEQVLEIAKKIFAANSKVLITRANKRIFSLIKQEIPISEYNEIGRIISIENNKEVKKGCIVVACGGTSDLFVAEEASVTASVTGSNIIKMYDIGIAGLHRLLSRVDILEKAMVVIAIAGMEGALPSVIASLIDKPVIAVPTSIGYGAHLNGITPLLAMVNSCVPGMSVVNINNGFGAGFLASMINLLVVNGGKYGENSIL